MKKLLSKTLVAAAAAASVFSASLPMAYAAEASTPKVTLNGDAIEIPARYINGKIYFSLADFWEEMTYTPSENIKWYEENQVLSNGSVFLSVKNQNWYRRSNQYTRLSDPVIFADGIVWTQPSILKDMNINTTSYEKNGDTLNFKQTFWEFPNGDYFPYRLAQIPLDKETGRPVFTSVEQVREKGSFSEKRFHILSQQLEDGKTIYAYINKNDPHKFLLVTCVDAYVAHILDNNGIFTYDDYGTRCAE